MLQAFLHNSGLSPLQRITLCQCVWHQHLTRCHRSENLKMVIAVVNHYQLRVQVLNHFACPSALVSSYKISLHHIDDNCFILWSFSTQKPPSMKVSDNCGFRYTFHKPCLCTHNLLRALISFSMRPIFLTPFQWSIYGLDIAKTTRICELCQGNVLSFQQLKHMVPYPFSIFSHQLLEHHSFQFHYPWL